MISADKGYSIVIVANGKFPENRIPLEILNSADVLVCCDGATNKVIDKGLKPTAIVGDLDSLDESLKIKYASILYYDDDQNTNDLTKAIKWCKKQGFTKISIVGATGLRDDHAIGNIGLLPLYAKYGLEVCMFTNYGTFKPILSSCKLKSYIGQQVSIFSTFNLTRITTSNLKYPINGSNLLELWMGTLNESLGDWFELDFYPGPLIIFQTY